MSRSTFVLAAAFALSVPRGALALPVVLEWTATSYATLDGAPFIPYGLNATTLTLTFRGDTDDVELAIDPFTGRQAYTLVGTTDLHTPELGTSPILADTIASVVEGPYAGVWLGLGISYPNGSGKLLFRMQDSRFRPYHLDTDLGPVSGDVESVGQFNDVPLTLGDFDVLSFSGVTFTAKVVPEPSTAATLALGLAALARRRTRRLNTRSTAATPRAVPDSGPCSSA